MRHHELKLAGEFPSVSLSAFNLIELLVVALGCGETSSELLVFDGISLNGSPLGKAHQGRANVLFCDGHVAPLKPWPWLAAPEVQRRMWNKDHEPHDLSWAPF